MPVPLYQVDAFTRVPFTGNPAAVCLLDEEPSDSWMQRVADEMNLSETAFVWPEDEDLGLRWFTPVQEVDLCGHATLASAHVLFETDEGDPEDGVTFHTNSGPLECSREDGWIRMAFPSHPPYALEEGVSEIAEALGVKPEWVGENGLDRFVVLEDETAVRALDPHLGRVAQLGGRGVIVTAGTGDDSGHDFVSRFFAPAYGVDEDPVTGSAHCALGPYWANKLDRDTVTGRQVSERGGSVRVTVTEEGVDLDGHAVTIFQGELAEAAEPT